MLISQVITKECLEDFTEEELFPIAEIGYEDEAGNGCYGTVKVRLKNGTEKSICFEEIEGNLTI